MGEALDNAPKALTKEFMGKTFYFEPTPTAPYLINEIFADNYKIFDRGLKFETGDVVLDIGANEGMFSIMIAKLFPFTRVIAIEPVSRTFFQMIRNIGLNGVTNIEPHCVGVAAANRPGVMNVHKEFSGGSSLVDTFDKVNHELIEVQLHSLDTILDSFNIIKVKLLKIDIEGGEYDALYAFKGLDSVENMVAEFHINKRLADKGYDINELATWCGQKTNLIYYDKCQMAE